MGKERIPNKKTRRAIEECEKGIGLKSFDTVEELFKDLNEKEENRNDSRTIKNDERAHGDR